MNVHLVVVRAFGPYGKGDVITAPAEVAAVLAGEHAGCAVKVRAAAASTGGEG